MDDRCRRCELLAPHFVLRDSPQDVQFVIRETRRKFQHTLSEPTVWDTQGIGAAAEP